MRARSVVQMDVINAKERYRTQRGCRRPAGPPTHPPISAWREGLHIRAANVREILADLDGVGILFR